MEFMKLAPSEVLDLATPCKEYQELMQTSKHPMDLDTSDPSDLLDSLRHFVTMQTKADKKDADVDEHTYYAPTRDGQELPLTVFRAAATTTSRTSESRPLIVLFFGGGFVLGSPTSMAALSRSLVKKFDAVVVTPTYRLAPEHPFPIGINDGWDNLSWIAKNATDTLRADPSKGFVVGGISAGANLTNVITHLACDRELNPPITGNWLSVAGVRLRPDDRSKLPQKYRERLLSRTQEACVNSSALGPALRKLFDTSLKPDINSELHAPLIWPTEYGHKRMPKTYSQVCGIDTGRDELLIYNDMLKNEGIETRLDLYPGLPHAFWYLYKQLPQSRQWEEDTMKGFAWLLGRSEQ